MSIVYEFVIPITVFLILGLLVWKLLFSHLVSSEKKLTVQIRESVIPDVRKATSSLVTLSSTAILLTFTILQIWNANEKVYLLIVSWIGFAMAIMTGTIIEIALYIFRVRTLTMLKGFKDLHERERREDDVLDDDAAYALGALSETRKLQRFIFFVLVLQPMLFSFSIFYLLLFAITNILEK